MNPATKLLDRAVISAYATAAGFFREETGGGCSALVRYLPGPHARPKTPEERDGGTIVIGSIAYEATAPENLEERVFVVIHMPGEWSHGEWTDVPHVWAAPSAREAMLWAGEQTSPHEAIARIPAHWEK